MTEVKTKIKKVVSYKEAQGKADKAVKEARNGPKIVCKVCGNGRVQLFRVVEKPKGKHKPLKGEMYKNTEYICVNCKA